MDKLKKLYDVLSRDGYYSKSFEEFQKQFQDASYQDKVYEVVSRDKLFTKSKDDFLKQYAVGPAKPIIEPLKKKEEIQPTVQQPLQGMESASEVGSSELPKPETPKSVVPPIQPKTDLRPAVARDNSTSFVTPIVEYEKFIQDAKTLQDEAKQKERAKAQEDEKIARANMIAAGKDPQFKTYLSNVNAKLIDKQEDEVVPELNRRFGSYGFHFEKSGAGDAMLVRTSDGKNEIEIDLDPFTTATEVEESDKLRKFLLQYAQGREQKSEDYIAKALRAQKIRDVGMRNNDGSYSTVKFTSFEQDGQYFVIPTLFPKDPNATYTTDKKDWMELPFEKALAEARKRGEVFEFNSDKEAKEFAEGDWKDVNAFDVEGQRFYKERGLDYYAEKQKYNNYTNVQDEIEFIDRLIGGEKITPEERMKYSQYFSKDGKLFFGDEALEKKREEAIAKRDNLLEQVYDVEVLGIEDGPVQKTREDFDLVLDKRQNEIAGEAIKLNKSAKEEYDALNKTAMAVYNVPIEKINTITPKTPQDAENIKNLTAQLVKVKAAEKSAATKFEVAKTYYDAKWNKATNSEYEENWAGFTTAVADAWNNGQAAEQILLLTLGIKDAENIKDREEAARLIVENLSSVSGKQSRVLTRANLARDGEFIKTLLADPFETMMTLATTSFTQMLPYGSYIVPSATATGVVAGATAGLMGGPFAEVTVPGGAITGGAQGFKTGMAATMFAMEYTNSIMDVMREKGYDLLDPKQVEAALSDEAVWAEGREIGVKRGVPIAVVDYLTAGLAGNVFRTSKLAATPVRVGAQVAERALFDPAAEALGEYTAMQVAGQDINLKEIAYEALGGLGNNTSHMAVNLYKEARNNSTAALAYELTDINRVANETVSDERISQWANNMHKLGKIDADVNQRIQENVGLRREARDIVSVGRTSRLLGDGKKVEARVMNLLAARNELSATQNRKEINRNKISQINQEIAIISETKKLLPENKDVPGDGVTTAVNLDAILGTTKPGVSQFMIGGKVFTREQFLKELDKMNNLRLLRARVNIENDKEVLNIYEQKIKKAQDAIQKQTTGQVPVQSEAGVSETVEERKPESEPQVTTQEGQVTVTQAEEVAKAEEDLVSSKTRLDELAEAIPQRIDYTEQDIANFDTLEEEKANGVITALAEKVAEGATLSDIENNVYNANKKKIDEVSNLVAERTAIEQEVSDLESMLQAPERKVEFKAKQVLKDVESTAKALDKIDKKQVQFLAVKAFNPMTDEYHVGIRSVDDIKTFEEAIKDSESFSWGDFSKEDAQKVLEKGEITVYSSKEISNGAFVSTSKNQAKDYAGGGKIYSKKIPLTEVAWINGDEGQYFDRNINSLSEAYHKAKEDESNPELVKAVERLIGEPTKAEFRAEQAATEAEAPQDEVAAITEQMNAIISGNTLTSLSPEAKQPEVDTTDLNMRVDNPIPSVSIDLVNGIPVVFTISDQLAAGTVTNTQTGREVTGLYGGVGFNGMNPNAAWAYTSEKNANTTLSKAQAVYNANKPTFEEFWENNPEYNGLVPMMVVKMGEGSILSNEATARVLADNISEFPESNRQRALKVLSKVLKDEIKSLKARAQSSKNELTKRNYSKEASGYQNILDLIAENNLQKIDDLLQTEIFTKIENLNARKDLINLIGYGKPNPPRINKAIGKPGKDSLVARAIIGIPATQSSKDIKESVRYELLNLSNVVNTITEQTIADVDNRSIVGIVGIDVLNPSVLNTENGDFTHPNYQYGLNGRVIGLLEQPVSLVEAYPEAYNLALQELIKAESEFVKQKKDGRKITKPGNRLFNQSIPEVAEIADRYYERAFGRQRPQFYGTRSIDKERAKRIADAFIRIVDNPTAPDVRKAYEAMARETLEQYKFMLEAGYFVEINNDEPYGNSREMVEDLRTNKRMKIFSTESGFGDEKITPEQRERNVLLRESGFYDVNGQPLLVNDVFRAVHDFFGHAELGNSFGAVGEENAWNVHARMYSPLARQAMTTETRGQNSYVNFSGVNERVEAMRQEAANLRNQGKNEEAEALVGKIYEEISFAEQKQGILPEEFWTIDTEDVGDKEFIPASVSGILTRALGVQNGLTQQEFVGAVADGNISNATKLTNFLNNAFPSVTISTDKVSFDNVMSQIGTEMFMRGDHIIYGVTVDGDIYINPDAHNSESAIFNTTIHEFGHIWTDYLQTSKKGKQIYARGVSLIEEAITKDENVKNIFDAQLKKYPKDRARAINETMAILIGNKGEVIVNAGIKSKFKEWLLGVWRFVKESFKMSKDLTPEEIQNLTLDGFIETALADIFSGNELSLTETQKKALKNPDAMFSSTQSMQSIIQQARANGFSDEAIKQVLLNRGFKAGDINNALVVQVNRNTSLPRAFANVKGGVNAGLQLFNDVRADLNRFSHLGPRGGVSRTQTKTNAEVRAKAVELLKAHRIYQSQSDTVQMELISAFDRTLNTSANKSVERQVSAIRNNLRQRKIGAKELQQAKIIIKNLIRSVLPASDTYSQTQINKLVSIVSNATESSILADTDRVMNIVQEQRNKMKSSVIKKIYTLVSKKAKPAMTTTGKRRSRGLDPEGQAFFSQVLPIIKAAISNDMQFMINLSNEISDAEANGLINDVIQKQIRGEKLTTKEKELLNKAYAYDTFGDIMNMSLEDVEYLLTELEDTRAESIRRLKTRREVRALKYAALNNQATAQVSELNPELFVEEEKEVPLSESEVGALQVGDEVVIEDTSGVYNFKGNVTVDFIDPNGDYISFSDGQSNYRFYLDGTPNIWEVSKVEIISRPKSRNELVQDRAAIRQAFQSGKIWSGFKQLVSRWDYTTITGIKDFVRKRILHLGSMMNLFDNNARGMTFFNDNIYRPLNRMDEQSKVGYFLEMANLDVIANSIPGITKGYKQIRSMLQTGIHTFTINGKEQIYNSDKLLRIYALSLNDVQREKLKQMGWDDAQIDKIKGIVGPEAIEFANKLVDYFSNDYYESINEVYSNVNDVNLGYVPNYFPTITQSQKVGAKLLEDGDFNGIFNAETAPALKERADTSGLIELNYDFSDVVESHFVTMEKYKAYAEGVKELNAIFKNPAFDVLLEESGMKTVVKRSVNFAITPNAGQKEEQTALGKMMTKFTGFALAFKAVQIVKQATSFINAYEDYSYFPSDSRIPGVIKGPIDFMMFMVDSAKVIATMPKQIRKAYGMSANVKDRLLKGIDGDVYGLEAGSNVFSSIDKRSDIWARAVRAFKTGAAAPTVLGDILGVMGYMVNYNRNIANGMSESEALEAFNNYNATAQSRRGTEKISIQQNSTELARAFTMFGSTTFLQINKVLAAQTNIFRALKEGKMPSAKDIRAFTINLGITNALFVGTANIAKFIKGDDDDRDEALKQMGKALVGLNLIESIPLIGAAVETALANIDGKRKTGDNVVNPYMQVYNKIQRASKEEVGFKSIQPIIEIVIGAQLDPFIGLYNGVTEGFDEEAIYDLLGISKSYRPTEEKDKKSASPKGLSKEDMKRYFPDMYNDIYGPYSNTEDTDPALEIYQKQMDEELQRAKDAAYGYVKPEKKKRK
jgi:hypothetical protein